LSGTKPALGNYHQTDESGDHAASHTKAKRVTDKYDLVCLSHLRWSFVFQRPQHLMSRCARERRVFFVEEPIFCAEPSRLEQTVTKEGVHVVVPYIEETTPRDEVDSVQAEMLRALLATEQVKDYVLWYYTPMALPVGALLAPLATVYDCMDQLSAFKGAPPSLLERERQLFSEAHLVFTGGHSLYQEKRASHQNIHAFPSSVDVAHFAQARAPQHEPHDQCAIPGPRLGFFGVIDERMDLELLAGVAAARPTWQLVILGPVVKIDEADLPRLPNIHYLGSKQYAELPSYIATWDVALLLFARNESTRFISPTKTPEYLAAGKPVVSTSITDVVNPYQKLGLVRIADTVEDFVAACEEALADAELGPSSNADDFLSQLSWDKTWTEMEAHLRAALRAQAREKAPRVFAPSLRVLEAREEAHNVTATGQSCSIT
jgi:glycosyltransferase involved in cell wall biosynthesis